MLFTSFTVIIKLETSGHTTALACANLDTNAPQNTAKAVCAVLNPVKSMLLHLFSTLIFSPFSTINSVQHRNKNKSNKMKLVLKQNTVLE